MLTYRIIYVLMYLFSKFLAFTAAQRTDVDGGDVAQTADSDADHRVAARLAVVQRQIGDERDALLVAH